MIEIDDKIVAGDVITAHFCCDIEQCNGQCCVEGNSGAPLLEDEMKEYEVHYDTFKEYMTPQGIEAIEKQGFGVMDFEGDLTTPLFEGRGEAECAYIIKDNGIAWCAIEKAYREGKCPVNKPISCHLYPIRLTHLRNGFTGLQYNKWDVCAGAELLGESRGIRVFQAVREAIERHFGKDFYEQLQDVADYIDEENELHDNANS